MKRFPISTILGLTLGILLAGVVVFEFRSPAQAGTSDNVSGWAWSETIGWISFNCTNDHDENTPGVQSCTALGGVDYGVNIDTTGNFSGYAWAETIGWIKFDPAGPYPSQPDSSAKLTLGNNEISGWARALANSGGWDGWIKLRKHASDGAIVPDYGVNVNPATGEFSGWAWGSDVVGWISTNCADTGSCALSNYKSGTDPNLFNAPPFTPPGSLNVTSANSADYCGITAYPPVRVNWSFSDPNPGDTQSAFQVQVFHGVSLVVDTLKKPGPSPSYVFQLTGEQLLWNTAYSWRVKVWDNQDASSSFTLGPSFTTSLHHFPVPNFSWEPSSPGIGEQVQFTDLTTFGPGSFLKVWLWDFENNGSTDSILQNPTKVYLLPATYGVKLTASDDVGSCETVKSLNIGVSLPEWQEISPF